MQYHCQLMQLRASIESTVASLVARMERGAMRGFTTAGPGFRLRSIRATIQP